MQAVWGTETEEIPHALTVTARPVKARKLQHAHAALTLTWSALTVPTLLWWKDSVAWVAYMSLWANIAAHASAWQGARAEGAANGDDS